MATEKTSRLDLPVFVALSLFVLILSGIAVVVEARPFVVGGGDKVTRFETLFHNRMSSGLSQTSARMVLDNCSASVTSAHGRLQPTSQRELVIANCLTQTKLITAAMPTDGLAWFVSALLAAEQADFTAMNAYLATSFQVTPFEQWIAALRVSLAEKFFDQLDDRTRAFHQRDLSMLVQNSRGIENIAARWVRDPDFRARIEIVVEALPEQSQVDFVRRVRVAVALDAGDGQAN